MTEVSFRVYDKSWIFEHMDFVRECFPHLVYLDEKDVNIRIQGTHGVVVAEVHGKPVGFSIWYETLPGIAYIWLAGVSRDYRGRGIGTVLLRAVLRHVEECGMRVIWCKISKGKVGWIRRHIKMGFRVIEHTREDGQDLYKLARFMGKEFPFIL